MSLSKVIASKAQQTPDAPAIALTEGQNTTTVSYHHVHRAALSLANYLVKSSQEGAYVLVFVEQGLALVVSMLACLYAGRPFVPLNADWPAERLRHCASDCAAEVILVHRHDLERLTHKLAVDSDGAPLLVVEPYLEPSTNDLDGAVPVPVPVSADDPATLVYTSGSTGRPKGAMCTYRNLLVCCL